MVLLIPLFALGIVNTMVSLKYETENPGDCISTISGTDLCNAIRNMKRNIVIDLILLVVLFIFKSKIIKKTT